MKSTIIKILDFLFIICTVVFVSMMVAMVVIQCYSLITLNGTLSSSILQIEPFAGVISAVAAVSSFILLYLRKPKSKENKEENENKGIS